MGLFKKIFKPVAKVLDKVIPNEIKPALPYLAAFAPVFGPPGLQSFIGESMKRRMLTSGLMNIGAQLSQEGNEGDINLLSAGIGALSGAMTAPGASDYFSMRAGLAGEGTGLMSQAQKFGFDTLAKGSDFLKTGGIDTAGGTTAKLLSTEGATVATLPAATATGDVMQAQARQLEKQAAIDAALAEAEALADSGLRGDAIRNAMRAYGFFTDDEIESTVATAGYKAGGLISLKKGGRVGFSEGGSDFGGITEAVEKIEKEPKTFLVDKLKVTMKPGQSEMRAIIEAMYNDVEGVMPDDRKKEFYELYAPQMYRNGEMEKSEFDFIQTEILGKEMKNGGRINFDIGGFEPFKYTSKIPEVFREDAFGSDPLGQILKMSYTVRAPLIDIIRTVAKTATEATKLAAAAVKLGYDVTEPVREVIGDVAGGIYDVAKKSVQESGDASRFIQPMYYLERFGPEKNLTDDETRLARLKRSIGRDDRDLIKTIENRIFGYDDAGINQTEEDKKVSDKIQAKIDERNFGFAEGGLMDLGGKEMDLRKGGFVPIGEKEKADDVPARLSKNEFVMTADAVRGAGDGDINKGAKRMYETMNTLEARA